MRMKAVSDKAGMERMLVMEGALQELMNAQMVAMSSMQARIDSGLAELAGAVADARRTDSSNEEDLKGQVRPPGC